MTEGQEGIRVSNQLYRNMDAMDNVEDLKVFCICWLSLQECQLHLSFYNPSFDSEKESRYLCFSLTCVSSVLLTHACLWHWTAVVQGLLGFPAHAWLFDSRHPVMWCKSVLLTMWLLELCNTNLLVLLVTPSSFLSPDWSCALELGLGWPIPLLSAVASTWAIVTFWCVCRCPFLPFLYDFASFLCLEATLLYWI